MKLIESNRNQIIKNIMRIKKTGRQRSDGDKLFIVEGLRFVSEIPADWNVRHYVMSDRFYNCNDKENPVKADTFLDEKICVVPDNLFKLISDTSSPQGILAVVEQKDNDALHYLSSFEGNAFFLVAENVSDPGNLGTIIRTCDAVGVDAVFLSKGTVDLYNPKTLRATMGSVFHLPIFVDIETEPIIDVMHGKGICSVATHLKAETHLYTTDFTGGVAVLIGNEANGLSEEISTKCRRLVKIPMPGRTESLNASIASAVVLYEILRQRMG